MRWKSWLFTLFILATTVGPAPAHAALIGKQLSLSELVAQSDGIFLGKVLSAVSGRASARDEISTQVTVRVQSTLKGRSDKEGSIRVQVPGGQLGDEIEVVSGAASFRVGEQVLIFVGLEDGGIYRTTGMAQGKYSLHQDALSNQRFAINDVSGLYFLTPDPLGRALRPVALARDEIPLAELLYDIRQLLETPLVMR